MHWRAYVCTREKVLPASLLDRESAKKFALRAHNTPKSACLRLPGELFRGNATGGAVLGELFRANRSCAQDLWAMRRTSGWWRWGFCSIRGALTACRRRVAALMMQFPPLGGSAAAVRGDVAPKTQTTSVKHTETGLLVAKWSAF